MAVCNPKDWFLDDQALITMTPRRPSGRVLKAGVAHVISIPQSELLPSRSSGWGHLLDSFASKFSANELADAKTSLTSAYTSNNEVRALVDGENYMGALYADITALTAGDFILIAGWEFWQYRDLCQRVFSPERNDAILEIFGHKNELLLNVIENAINKGVEVRVLAFKSRIPGVGERTKNFVEAVNKIKPNSAYQTAPTNFAMSHHQKEVFIGRSKFEDSCAYVGGIDLSINRFDDCSHSAKDVEQAGVLFGVGRNYGWHDIQVRVRGDAILQLWANFAERWKDAQNKKGGSLLDCPHPQWIGQQWKNRKQNLGKQHVQVLRTVGPASSRETARQRFMKDGERTVLGGLWKAILNAESYIYIEEQFLWDCELADFIADQMKKNSNLHLIIVMTAGCELPAMLGQYAFRLRHRFFKRVMGVSTAEEVEFGDTYKVYPYGLFQTKEDGREEIYVHSKLIIIDDRYVAVGSANVDARSMHIETELTASIVDGNTVPSKPGRNQPQVCEFARDLREQLWKEHSDEKVLPKDPIEALKKFPGVGGAWPKNATKARKEQKHHLRCYIDIKGAYPATQASRRLLDRNERNFKED